MFFMFVASCWLIGLLSVGYFIFILILFAIYKLNGGKLNFIKWFKKIKF